MKPAELVGALTGQTVRRTGPDGRVELADGRTAVLKRSTDPGSIAAEVAGLRWLSEPGHLGVPEVLGHDERRVQAGYQEVSPLPEGWAGRVGLHQLFPLLVHVTLFGRGYAGRAVAAARSVLAIGPTG